MGMIPQGQKLSDWARFNTPGYMMAQQSSNAAFGAYENAVARSGGALSGQWSNDLNKLNQVSDGIGNYSPGSVHEAGHLIEKRSSNLGTQSHHAHFEFHTT